MSISATVRERDYPGRASNFDWLSVLMICFAIIKTAKVLRQDKRASRIDLSAF